MDVLTFTGCTGCGACLLTCPTHAIRPTTDTPPTLMALPALCTACAECIEICPADAITLSPGELGNPAPDSAGTGISKITEG